MNREDALYNAKHLSKTYHNLCNDTEGFWQAVINALEQEPSDEWQNGYDMAWEEAKVFYEKEPCEDAISKQAVLDNIKNGFHWESVNGITAETVLKQVIHDVEIMPSVQQEPKTGHWIKLYMSDTGEVKHECSLCGFVASGKWKYCCECGARVYEN